MTCPPLGLQPGALWAFEQIGAAAALRFAAGVLALDGLKESIDARRDHSDIVDYFQGVSCETGHAGIVGDGWAHGETEGAGMTGAEIGVDGGEDPVECARCGVDVGLGDVLDRREDGANVYATAVQLPDGSVYCKVCEAVL